MSPGIDSDFWKLVLEIARWIALGIVAGWTYLRTKDSDNARAIGSVKKTVADHGTRLTTIEETLKHMPTHEDQALLREDVAGLTSNVEGMKDLLKRVEHQTNLIHEHLLSKK